MAAADQKPNVLLIMSDQHRYDYMGCTGADFLHTPNLDRLAARGVRFTTCVTNSPICAPARIGLAAGMQPPRLGSEDNRSFLPRSQTTYYQRLRDHGYRVGCIGKLDLAKPDGYNGVDGDRPCVYGWGFTHPCEAEGKMHAGNSAEPRGPYGLMLQGKGLYQQFHEDYVARRKDGWSPGGSWDSVLPTELFEDAWIGYKAADWIREIPDDFPWHYFVSFAGPHDPFDPPTEYADKYRDVDVPEPIADEMEGKPRWIANRSAYADPEQVAVARRQYCASTQIIDDAVGRIMDALEARGELDNTYIIYSSDHGEMLGDHGLWTKSVPYEASTRVPLIVAGPDIEGGRVSDALVELIDLNPTICELAGLPPQADIDAESICRVVRGEADEHREDCVSAMPNFRCIRTATHKYVLNYNDRDELYDLQADPQELHNIIDQEPDVGRELHWRLMDRYTEGKWRR